MNGQELIERFVAKSGVDKEHADRFYKEFFQVLIEGLEKEGYVRVKGLGSFKLLVVERRESVNINTGERFEIQGHNRISFTPEPGLKELVNKPFAHLETVMLAAESPMAAEAVETAKTAETTETTEAVKTAETVKTVETVETAESEDEKEAAPVVESAAVPVETKAETVEAVKEAAVTEVVAVKTVESEDKKETESVAGPSAESVAGPSAESVVASVVAPIAAPTPAKPSAAVEKNKPRIEESPAWIRVARWIMVVVFVLCVLALLMLYVPGLRKIVFEKRMRKAMETEMQMEAKADTTLPDAPQAAAMATEHADVAASPAKTTVETVVAASGARAATTAIEPDSVNYDIVGTQAEYTIGEGETLARVALHFYGTKALWPYIVKYNQAIIPNPDRVTCGLKVRIPRLERKGE